MAVQHITSATRVPVPGGKIIDEYVGRASTGESRVSVAHMRAPGGWTEPGQQPAFDEWTLVLAGTLRVEHADGELAVHAGEAVLVPAGDRVRYGTGDDGAEYVAICLPAFGNELVHRDDDQPPR